MAAQPSGRLFSRKNVPGFSGMFNWSLFAQLSFAGALQVIYLKSRPDRVQFIKQHTTKAVLEHLQCCDISALQLFSCDEIMRMVTHANGHGNIAAIQQCAPTVLALGLSSQFTEPCACVECFGLAYGPMTVRVIWPALGIDIEPQAIWGMINCDRVMTNR